MFWSLTIIVSLCLIYAPITALKNDPHKWTKFEKILYACSRHLLWGILLAWVTYACEYGYGGESNGQKERKELGKKELGREEGIKTELEELRKEGIRKGGRKELRQNWKELGKKELGREEGIKTELEELGKKELGKEEGIKTELEGIRKGEIRQEGIIGSLRKEFKGRIRERT